MMARVPPSETWESRRAKLNARSTYEMLSGSTKNSKPGVVNAHRPGVVGESNHSSTKWSNFTSTRSNDNTVADDDMDLEMQRNAG